MEATAHSNLMSSITDDDSPLSAGIALQRCGPPGICVLSRNDFTLPRGASTPLPHCWIGKRPQRAL
jgi:hypothetical protein